MTPIEVFSLIGPIALASGAAMKLWAKSQPKGAILVLALAAAQFGLLLKEREALAAVFGTVAIGFALVLIWAAERRSRGRGR